MSALKNSRKAEVTRYEAPSAASRATTNDALADALARILTGRTLAEHLAPMPLPLLRPESAEQGIAWILAGPGANRVH